MLLIASDERGSGDDLKLQFEAASRLDPKDKNVIRSVIESIAMRNTGTMMSTELLESLKLNAFLVSVDGKTRVELKTLSHLEIDEYAIVNDAAPAANRTESSVEISLEFPTYFVPKERGINADPRKLVVLVPRSLRLVAGPTNDPPSLTAGAKP